MKPTKPPEAPRYVSINVKVLPDLYEAVKAKAEADSQATGYPITITDVVKRALSEYVAPAAR